MYAANHYIRAAGQVYVAGEILPELPEDKIRWLKSVDAIREIGPAPAPETPARAEETAPVREEGPDPEEVPEEIDEEAEPEEIDVMAGIVTESKPSVSKGTAGKSSGRKRK